MKKVFLLAALLFLIQTAFVTAYPADFDGWRVMPIRSEEEFNQGAIGGEAEQHNHGIARSLYNPDVIYLSHDIGGVWRSRNAGDSWDKSVCRGLFLAFGQSIEVDPVDPDTVFIIVQQSYNYKTSESYEGVYRSKDGGESFEQVLSTPVSKFRAYTHNIAYDLSTTSESPASRWYAAFFDNGLYRSEDGGGTWAKVSDLSGHDPIYAIQTHPSDGQTIYLGSSQGLYKSSSRGTNLQKIGNLPSGDVSAIAINLENPKMVYVTVRDNGLYRSSDGGYTFSLVKSFDAEGVFINPGYPDVIYLVGISSNTIISHDAGNTWITDMCTEPAPGLARDITACGSGWKGKIAGGATGIVPNPENENEAVAFSRATIWKTTDGGQIFKDSSTLWTGFAWGWAVGGVAFDREDPDRFAFFDCDVTMTMTENGGDYFEQKAAKEAWQWKGAGIIDWVNMLAGDFQPGSNVMVGSVGDYFSRILARSADNGDSWQIVDQTLENSYFVAFHPDEPNIVYAGSARSVNGGQTFQHISYLNNKNALIVGMCNANPDIVYAFSRDNATIYRSDDKAVTWDVYTDPGWSLNKHDSLPTFAVDPFDCDKIYTVASDGDLGVYNGTSWRSAGVLALTGTPSGLSNFVRGVALDPIQEGIIYAGMFASGLPAIFRSTDGGYTWEDISYNKARHGSSGFFVNPYTGELFDGSGYGTWVLPPPYESQNLFYDKLISRPSCQDGLKNGDEEGIDCGGSCPTSCRTCSDDPECLSGEKCCDGYCVTPACTESAGCGTGQQCNNPGLCDAACQNIQCGEGQITSACYCGAIARTSGYCCSGTYYTSACPECTVDSECDSGEICCNDACAVPTCRATTGCGTGQQCTSQGQCDAQCQNIDCGHGEITSACYCEGQPRTTGYCCSGSYQTTECQQIETCGNGQIDPEENCENCPQDIQCQGMQICCTGTCLSPECSSDQECPEEQHCTSTDPCTGQCIDCNITCSTDAECDDQDEETTDTCINQQTCESFCRNEPLTCGGQTCQTGQICCNDTCTTPTCTKSSDCDDSQECTRDYCSQAGTCNAECTHTEIPKCGWKNMTWILPSCFPINDLFEVTVTDETGNPLQGVTIKYGTQTKTTDTTGKTELIGEKAKYLINANKEGYYPLNGKKIATTTCNPTYTTTNGKPPTTGREKINIEIIDTPYIGKQFTLKITDKDGNPIQGATIEYSNQTTTTDQTGQASLTGEKAKYLITATATQGKETTKILPKTYTETTDQNASGDGTTEQPFALPLDIIAFIAIIIVGGIILLRARKPKKRTGESS